MAHHETDSRKSAAGFPDLCVATDRVWFAELKAADGKPLRIEQARWIVKIGKAGGEVYVWRPHDLDEAMRVIGRGRVTAGVVRAITEAQARIDKWDAELASDPVKRYSRIGGKYRSGKQRQRRKR